jgi:hypothetical protein
MSGDPRQRHELLAIRNIQSRGIDLGTLHTQQKVIAQPFQAINLKLHGF